MPPNGSVSTRAVRIAALAFALSALAAIAFDAWYRGTLVSRERERVRAFAAPFASALESVTNGRVSRLAGLKTFVETRGGLNELWNEFDRYAAALGVGVPGLRALQLVDRGVIVATRPAVDSSLLVGRRLLEDSRPEIRRGVARAMASDSVVVSGPIELMQGGMGLVVRQRVHRGEESAPDMVSMAVDLDALLDEARGIARPPATVALTLRDREGRVVDGPTGLDDPVRVPVRLPDGNWQVEAAPVGGWYAAIADDLSPTRVASALIALLLSWLAFNLIGRQERLTAAVSQRTVELERTNDELLREVRERESVEQRLRENDERLRLALNSGHMGTWEYDPAADRVYWSANAMAILGAAPEDRSGTGREFVASLPAEFRESVVDAVRQARAAGSGQEWRTEFRFTLPDGTERWLYASGELQEGDGSRPERLVGVLVDVTERRHLEEQLLQSQKMEAVGTLAGGIAHDFNNLLTAILGFAQLSQMQAASLSTDAPPDEIRHGLDELRTDLDEIVKAGERASLLTSQLLAFSRRQVHKPTRVDINSVVHETERMLQRLIGERITLTTDVAADPLPVLADPGQIAQVIVNLVVNARDALPSGGAIALRTSLLAVRDPADAPFAGLAAGDWVVIEVEDNGTGMSPEVMGRIFEPFFTTKRVGEGTGLGLSTVYGIVTQGGGRVFVQSAPGEGTSMHVLLPVHASAAASFRGADATADSPARSARVLVVEDEPGLRRLVAEILTRRGYAVDVASDGIEALERLDAAAEPPDLVLSDVVMPRMGGRALADEIARRGLVVPVLFMSGYPAGQELPEDEGHTFIGKPFTPDSLVRKVRAVLERAGATGGAAAVVSAR